jgi:WD40 repeat protein
MIRQPARIISTLIVSLLLAECGDAAPTTPARPSPARTPAAATQAVAQATPIPPAPASTPSSVPASTPTPAGTPAPTMSPSSSAAEIGAGPTVTPAFPEQQITADTLAQVELLRTVGFGPAGSAAFSPDQSLLAVATSGGIAWYSLPALEHLRFTPIEGGAGDIQFVDGQTVEIVRHVSSEERQLERRRIADGGLLEARTEPRTDLGRGHLVDSPSGDLQARFSLPDTTVYPGVEIARTSDQTILYEDEDSENIAFAADGTTVALVTYQGIVRVVDLLRGHTSEVYLPGYDAVAFSPDGQQLVTAGQQLNLWDVVSGELVQNEAIPIASDPGLMGKSQRLRYSADGSALTVDGSYTAFEAIMRRGTVWKVADGQASFDVETDVFGAGVTNYGTYVGAISPANHDGAFTNDGFTLQLQRDNQPRHVLDRQAQISGLEFSPDGGRLAIADVQGGVEVVNSDDGSVVQSFSVNPSVAAFAFSEDGALLAAVSNDGSIRVWEIATGRIAALIPNAGAVARPVFTSDSELLLAPSQEGLRFYRLSDGALLHMLPVGVGELGSPDSIFSPVEVAIGPRRRLVAVLHDGYIQLWGIR